MIFVFFVLGLVAFFAGAALPARDRYASPGSSGVSPPVVPTPLLAFGGGVQEARFAGAAC